MFGQTEMNGAERVIEINGRFLTFRPGSSVLVVQPGIHSLQQSFHKIVLGGMGFIR